MYIGHQLGKTVPELVEMNFSEYCYWRAYFTMYNEQQDKIRQNAINSNPSGRGRR